MASVFAGDVGEMYLYRKVTLQFRDRLMGGVPKDPKIIEGWIRTKAMVTDDEELRQMALRTLRELGADVNEGMTYEEAVAAAEAMAFEKHTNGFKRDEKGLYLEGRQIKAMLKENVNIVMGGERKGATSKGAKGYAAERVFVVEDRVYLDRTEPDGVEVMIGHISGPQGPRATLTNVEYVTKPQITFTIKEMLEHRQSKKDRDAGIERGGASLSDAEWRNIWLSAEENGLGAARSQSHGRFEVVKWEVITS